MSSDHFAEPVPPSAAGRPTSKLPPVTVIGSDALPPPLAGIVNENVLLIRSAVNAVTTTGKGYDLLTKRESPPQRFVGAARKDLAAA